MSSGFSGDWREWQGNLELIAFSAVNTPGFRRKAALTEEPMPIAASGSDSHFGPGRMVIDMPNSEEEAVTEDHDMVLASAAERVARSIGRSPAQIAERLHLRVHG
jgi:hypothetical protein